MAQYLAETLGTFLNRMVGLAYILLYKNGSSLTIEFVYTYLSKGYYD